MHEINIHPDVKEWEGGGWGTAVGNLRAAPVKKDTPAEVMTEVKA